MTCKTAHGRRAIETIGILRPDLDPEAELKIVEDFEVGDNEGLTVLARCSAICWRLCRADRWTVVTSATERLARVRLAAGGIPAPSAGYRRIM